MRWQGDQTERILVEAGGGIQMVADDGIQRGKCAGVAIGRSQGDIAQAWCAEFVAIFNPVGRAGAAPVIAQRL